MIRNEVRNRLKAQGYPASITEICIGTNMQEHEVRDSLWWLTKDGYAAKTLDGKFQTSEGGIHCIQCSQHSYYLYKLPDRKAKYCELCAELLLLRDLEQAVLGVAGFTTQEALNKLDQLRGVVSGRC